MGFLGHLVRITLQKDLDTLREWAENWQITYNVNNCEVMHTGTNNRNYDYSTNGQSLDRATEHNNRSLSLCVQQGKSDAGTYQTNC